MDLLKRLLIFSSILYFGETIYEGQHRPCLFNPLCTCSNSGPDLGSVICYDVPFTSIQDQIKLSAIYILILKNNDLQVLEEHSFNGTSLWKLQISKNPLTNLPRKALAGLEKTVSILDLSDNNFITIPEKALEQLEKLQILNLAKNNIIRVEAQNTVKYKRNLKELNLAENSISYIDDDAFKDMNSLENLNLAMNFLTSLNASLFQSGLNNLKYIDLTGNQLIELPYPTLTALKNLKILNLNKNLISEIGNNSSKNSITLDELHLDENMLENLPSSAFQNFRVNKISLRNNPLLKINEDTFLNTNASEIDMSYCILSEFSVNLFHNLEETLKILDLRYNDITSFHLKPLRNLVKLDLRGNKIKVIDSAEFELTGNALQYVDVSGNDMGFFPNEILKYLPNIKFLSYKPEIKIISKEDFKEIGHTLEELRLTHNHITTIENQAFFYLFNVKRMDLSYNSIRSLSNTSFKDVGHSLQKLILHKALTLSVFPYSVFKYLSHLEYIDVSNNKISILPSDSFKTLRLLKYINLNHNFVSELNTRHFDAINSPNLKHIKIAFNKLKVIQKGTFKHLKGLEHIELNDNSITSIHKGAFSDLNSLKSINLAGNKISSIEKEAFRNLPKIQKIDLSYNFLETIDLNVFDQVGRLSTLKLNIQHNKLQELSTVENPSRHISSNIKIIDFSYNNISDIENHYFDSVRNSLNILELKFNKLQNLTNSAFSGMNHLQVLSVAYNNISELEHHTLQGLVELQVFNASHNHIDYLPVDLLKDQRNLRIIDLSENEIREFNSNIFQNTILESLNAALNQLTNFPTDSLMKVNASLQSLNLAGNCISNLNSNNVQHLENLKHLSLSNTAIRILEEDIFKKLPKLITLDLSLNKFEIFPEKLYLQKDNNLRNLNIAKVNLDKMPKFFAPNLELLNVSYNSLKNINHEALTNSTNIQVIDLSFNNLSNSEDIALSPLPLLRTLYLNGNPITSFKHLPFSEFKWLQELHLTNLKLEILDANIFVPLTTLKKLSVDVLPNSLSLSEILKQNQGLRNLNLHIQDKYLKASLTGDMPKSLTTVTLEGNELDTIEENAFVGVQSGNFFLKLRNSGTSRLSKEIFQNMKKVQNLSVSFENHVLKKVDLHPFSSPNEPGYKNLKLVDLRGTELNCGCEFIWMWEWFKQYPYEQGCEEEICDNILNTMRETKCSNDTGNSLIDVFKTDLVCTSAAIPNILSQSLRIWIVLLHVTACLKKFVNYF